MSERDFYQPITKGGGNYAVSGPLGALVEPYNGGVAYHFTPHSRGHAKDQRFLSGYRLSRYASRSKYLSHQGKRECARRRHQRAAVYPQGGLL